MSRFNRFNLPLLRLGLLVSVASLFFQIFFFLQILFWRYVNPVSTAFERSQLMQLLKSEQAFSWRQTWLDYEAIAETLKAAVISSEDSDFVNHSGVEWAAVEKAWKRNAMSETKAQRINPKTGKPYALKLVGGSTITQQIAKNLFLSGERSMLRKAQELLITMQLEWLLPKQRIFEIYLNHAEWGTGTFGAQAASQLYFQKNANLLNDAQAARLAVMLPGPKLFEKNRHNRLLAVRTQTILQRMREAEIP